jgi:tetratricopeptide (TPR) repeat protein
LTGRRLRATLRRVSRARSRASRRAERQPAPAAAVGTPAALPAAAPNPRFDRRLLALSLLLVLAVGAVYGQTARHEFITFDDDMYILNNREVTGGLSWAGLRWAFGFHAGNWHPLTWVSHMLDVQLFGLWAGGHHLVSVGLHAANAVLLLALLAALTGALWPSAAVAALFALHPLRVESVVWAAERKDVLSALFWLLCTGAYLRHLRRPGPGRYLLALGLFAAGLAAKPMLVTLPFALLLLDWWPLGRALRRGEPGAVLPDARTAAALLAEKLPFFSLSLLSSAVTLRAQTEGVIPFVTPAFGTRFANAAVSYVRYVGSFAWPDGLAFLYPYPRAGVPLALAAAALAALALVSAAAVYCGRRRPYLPFGWFWYLGTLVPVIGLVQVGGQARSDRYTYLTTVGLAVALVWLVAERWPRGVRARRALAGAFALALLALAGASAAYARVWRESLTLYQYTAGVTKDNFIVLNNLGSTLMSRGRTEEAIGVLEQTERVNPAHCNAPYNLGTTLIRLARYQEALAPLTRALSCYEREGRQGAYLADTHFNLGAALSGVGRYPEAEREFATCLQIVPNYPGAAIGLGEAQVRQGSWNQGRRQGER